MDIEISHRDFIAVCGIDDPSNFAWGLRVDEKGIWAIAPDRPELLTKAEYESIRPPRGFDAPILAFPCSPEKLKGFLQWAGMDNLVAELEAFVNTVGGAFLQKNSETKEIIKMLRNQGMSDSEIAIELYCKHNLSNRKIGLALGLDKGLNIDQRDALKQRVQRLRGQTGKSTKSAR